MRERGTEVWHFVCWIWDGGGGGGVGEKKAAFIEHRSGVGSAYFTFVASCLMTRLDVLPSAYLLESFHSGLKKRRVERTLCVCVCVCVCNAILHMADVQLENLALENGFSTRWLNVFRTSIVKTRETPPPYVVSPLARVGLVRRVQQGREYSRDLVIRNAKTAGLLIRHGRVLEEIPYIAGTICTVWE